VWRVAVDALDEAATDFDRDEMVRTLMGLSGSSNVRVVVATRPLAAANRYAAGAPLPTLGVWGAESHNLIDLDGDAYFELHGLETFVTAVLKLEGSHAPGPPGAAWTTYRARPAQAQRLAATVARRAERNYLVAALAADPLARQDADLDPADPGFNPGSLPASLGEALRKYLYQPALEHRRTRVRGLLEGLAYARGSGVDDDLWLAFATSLGYNANKEDLYALRDSAAVDYLLQTQLAPEQPVTRLFHQALSDELLAHRPSRASDERALLSTMQDLVRAAGWAAAPTYLKTQFVVHAGAADRLDEVLSDDELLLHADLTRVLAVADALRTPAGALTAKLVRLTPGAVDINAKLRIAAFGLTECLEGLPPRFRNNSSSDQPYRALWATGSRRAEAANLEGPDGWVWAVCTTTFNGQPAVAAQSDDGGVYVWDLRTQALFKVLKTHTLVHAYGLASIEVNDGAVLSMVDGHEIALWNLQNGEPLPLNGQDPHDRPVSLTPIHDLDGQQALAVGYNDGRIKIWDSRTWAVVRQTEPLGGAVYALTAYADPEGPRLAAAGKGGQVRLLDAKSGRVTRTLKRHRGRVFALRAFRLAGQTLLASGGADRVVRLWDVASGQLLREFPVQHWVGGLGLVGSSERPQLLVAHADTVEFLDPVSGESLGRHDRMGCYRAYQPVTSIEALAGSYWSATADIAGSVHLWDQNSTASPAGSKPRISNVAAIAMGGETLIGASQGNAINFHDSSTGSIRWALRIDDSEYRRRFTQCGSDIVVVAQDGQSLEVRDLPTGGKRAELLGHKDTITGLRTLAMPGGESLAISSSYDRSVRIWRPTRYFPVATFEGHSKAVDAVCPVYDEEDVLVASAGRDGSLRLWDMRQNSMGRRLRRPSQRIGSLTTLELAGRTCLIGGDANGALRYWFVDGSDWWEQSTVYDRAIESVCGLTVRGEPRVALASYKRTVCLVDPAEGEILQVIPVHHAPVTLCSPGDGRLVVGTESGLICLALAI